jgi:hypothetical protein
MGGNAGSQQASKAAVSEHAATGSRVSRQRLGTGSQGTSGGCIRGSASHVLCLLEHTPQAACQLCSPWLRPWHWLPHRGNWWPTRRPTMPRNIGVSVWVTATLKPMRQRPTADPPLHTLDALLCADARAAPSQSLLVFAPNGRRSRKYMSSPVGPVCKQA